MSFKIPNIVNKIGIGVALGLTLLETLILHSLMILFWHVFCAAIIFAICYSLYKVGGIGAGDVKLLLCLGLLIRFSILEVLFWSLISACVIGGLEVYKNKSVVVENKFGLRLHKIHFSYAILSGLVITCILYFI